MDNHSENIVKTADVIGKDVKSARLEDLGEVEEIVMDKNTGEARYVVVSFGGFMGLGEDYYAFPWRSISYNKAEECFILNVDKSKLKKEYGFNKNQWPDVATWSTTVDRYYD